jgi:hypothetical protein
VAAEWIKWVKGLADKREVLLIAAELSIAPDEAAGRLMRLWEWCDDNIGDRDMDENGNASVTLGALPDSLIDALTRAPGTAKALQNAGWLRHENGQVVFPNFGRHNGKTAKTRALTQKRAQRCRNAVVTLRALPEENRREESIKKETKAKKERTKFVAPTLDEVAAYCRERSNGIDPEAFLAHYEANGWVQGRGKPIKSWKAAMRTWEARRRADQSTNSRGYDVTAEDDAQWTP